MCMTEQEVDRYLELVDRRLAIITSGKDWKPEYGPELAAIDRELAGLKPLAEKEQERFEAGREE